VTTLLLVAVAVTAVATLLALMLCVAAARADRRLRGAMLADSHGWRPQDDWMRSELSQTKLPYREHAAN